MNDLILHVKGEYFDEIVSGKKKEEYRLLTPYWEKRLYNKDYDFVIIKWGYPKTSSIENTIMFPYRGYKITKITHKHFGDSPVGVFAIPLVK